LHGGIYVQTQSNYAHPTNKGYLSAALWEATMRKALIVVGIFIVVVIAGLLIFAATFDVNRYRGTIQSELEKRLRRQVTLGEMHLRLFPPRFRVENVAVSDDPKFSKDVAFVKAQELDVAVKLLPLLHKDVQIESVNLQRPVVNLIKNPAGTWNFASLGGQTQKAEPSSPNDRQQFSLGELMITDGQISVLDQAKSKTPSLYDHIDISLKNFSPNTAFTVDAGVRLAGSSQEAKLKGEGGPIVNGNPAQTSFHGTLSLKQIGLADFAKFMNSPTLEGTDGIISGETRINHQAGKLTAQGRTEIKNAKVRGMELGFPISAQYDLTDDISADMLSIQNMLLKLGSTPLELSGTLNSKQTPALLDIRAKASNVSIAEAAKLAAASGAALSQDTTATGNVNLNIQAHGSADKPALNGTITGSNIQLSGKSIAQPIQIASINLNLTPSQVQSNPFNVVSGGTTLNTQFTIRNYQSPSPNVDATVRAPNAQLSAILAMAKAYGVKSLDKVTGEGTLNLNMKAAGPVKSLSSAEVMRALNGTVDLNFNTVKYSGANISHELSTIAGFLNPNAGSQSTGGVTNISKVTGNIVVKNGVAQTNNMNAVLDIGNVGAVGTANLVDETLNLRVTAVLSQAASQKAGGNSVGGFMQTALANNQGELVVPALVTGTFSNPKFAPDVQQIAQMKLKGFIPNLQNPGSIAGALQGLLGGSKANPNNPAQTQQQQQDQQNDPLQQVLGILGKKKKPQ
jgi:AsmA protein